MQVALFWEMLHILEFVPHGKKNYDRHHRLEAFIHKVIRRRNFTYVTMSKRKKIRGRKKKSRKVIATSCKTIRFVLPIYLRIQSSQQFLCLLCSIIFF